MRKSHIYCIIQSVRCLLGLFLDLFPTITHLNPFGDVSKGLPASRKGLQELSSAKPSIGVKMDTVCSNKKSRIIHQDTK